MKYSPSSIRMWSRLGPSGVLSEAAMELGKNRNDVVFASADMSFPAGLERFKRKYPDRHFDIGIAEQNLIGFSAGLAGEKFVPYAVTYSTFFAARALDQIKMCMGYMKLNIKLIGILAGFTMGELGATHMSIEDIAIIRAIPNIILLSPADTTEAMKSILYAAEVNAPVFIRLTGAMNNPAVYADDYNYEPGKAIKLREGDDVGIIATGSMVYNSLKAAEILAEKNIQCEVIDMHTIKPFDSEVVRAMRNKKLIVTVEEHSIIGGLGGAVSEALSGISNTPVLLRLGVRDYYPNAASYEILIEECGLNIEGIADSILNEYRNITV